MPSISDCYLLFQDNSGRISPISSSCFNPPPIVSFSPFFRIWSPEKGKNGRWVRFIERRFCVPNYKFIYKTSISSKNCSMQFDKTGKCSLIKAIIISL